MKRLMIDTETLGLEKNAVVFQIGATVVGAAYPGFSFTVNPLKLIMHHGSGKREGVNENTVKWHQENNYVNWSHACETPWTITSQDMIEVFNKYLFNVLSDGEDYEIWCKGTDFDIPILDNAFKNCGYELPWKYNRVRDLRTAIALVGDPNIPKVANMHDALIDAQYQAKQLEAILEKLNDFDKSRKS